MKHLHLLRAAAVVAFAALAACGGKDGDAGPPGDKGAAGEPTPSPTSIDAISPRYGLLGRKVQVHLAFDGQKVDDKATVKVGDLAVSKVTADAGTLLVDLDIPATTTIGPRDVTVTSAGANVVAKAGFVVAAPIDVKVAGGKAAQGSLVQLDIANLDKTWFDTRNFVLVSATGSSTDASLVQLMTSGLTATDGSIFLVGDPLVQTGKMGFLGINDPQDSNSATYLSAPDAVSVDARDPEAVTAGTPVDKTLANPLETAYFTATASPAANEALIVDAHAVTPAGSTLQPLVLAYPATGRISDLLDQKKDDPGFPGFIPPTEARVAYPVVGAAAKAFYIVVDTSLKNSASTKLRFDYTTYRAALVAEAAGDHSATPQDLGALPLLTDTAPGIVVQGELATAAELDTYSFSGLDAGTVIDLQVSLTSDVTKIGAIVDTVATFDSNDVIQVQLGGTAGSGSTSGVKGAQRFIQVSGAKGKYTLGIRRSN